MELSVEKLKLFINLLLNPSIQIKKKEVKNLINKMENIIEINNENIQVIRNGEVDMKLFTESLIDFFLKYMFDEEESSSNNCA